MTRKLEEGRLLARPNRFILTVMQGGKNHRLYLANPGRLKELVFPGVRVLFDPLPNPNTDGTVEAIEDAGGSWVPLHTGRANDLAQFLIDEGRWPGLEGWRVLRREVVCGDSRFDLLLGHSDGRRAYGEVKCCTLFACGGAYFPDAPSPRAVKHLLGLQALAREGTEVFALPLVMSGRANWWCPDWHTDFVFAKTAYAVRRQVSFLPCAVDFDGRLQPRSTKALPVPWGALGNFLTSGGCLFAACGGEQPRYAATLESDLDRALRAFGRRKEKLFGSDGSTAVVRPFRGMTPDQIRSVLGGQMQGDRVCGSLLWRPGERSYEEAMMNLAFGSVRRRIEQDLGSGKKTEP